MARDLSQKAAGVEEVQVSLDGGPAGAGLRLGLGRAQHRAGGQRGNQAGRGPAGQVGDPGFGPCCPGGEAVEGQERGQNGAVRALQPGGKSLVGRPAGGERPEPGERQRQKGQAALACQTCRQDCGLEPSQMFGPFVQAAPEMEGGAGPCDSGERRDRAQRGLDFGPEE